MSTGGKRRAMGPPRRCLARVAMEEVSCLITINWVHETRWSCRCFDTGLFVASTKEPPPEDEQRRLRVPPTTRFTATPGGWKKPTRSGAFVASVANKKSEQARRGSVFVELAAPQRTAAPWACCHTRLCLFRI